MIKENINSDKLLSFFSFIPLHPNHLTLLSVLFALIAFVIFPEYKLYSIILFGIAFFIDAIDGAVARAKNLVSKKGAFIDGISDRLVEFFLILTIIVYFSFDFTILIPALCVLFFGTCMTGYVKAYAHHQGLLTEEKAKKLGGILQRAERVILLFVSLVLFVYVPSTVQVILVNDVGSAYLPLTNPSVSGTFLLIITAILSFITFIQRIYLVLNRANSTVFKQW